MNMDYHHLCLDPPAEWFWKKSHRSLGCSKEDRDIRLCTCLGCLGREISSCNTWKGATGCNWRATGSWCNGAMAMSLHVAHFVFLKHMLGCLLVLWCFMGYALKIRYFGTSNISNNTGPSRTCIFHRLVSWIKLPDVADQLRSLRSQVACRFGHPEIVKLLLEAGTGRRWEMPIRRCGDAKMPWQWSSLGKGHMSHMSHMVMIKLDQHLVFFWILLPMVDFLLKHPMEILRR